MNKKAIGTIFSLLLVLSLLSVGIAEASRVRIKTQEVDSFVLESIELVEKNEVKTSITFFEGTRLRLKAYDNIGSERFYFSLKTKNLKDRNYIESNDVNEVVVPATIVWKISTGKQSERKILKVDVRIVYDEDSILVTSEDEDLNLRVQHNF